MLVVEVEVEVEGCVVVEVEGWVVVEVVVEVEG